MRHKYFLSDSLCKGIPNTLCLRKADSKETNLMLDLSEMLGEEVEEVSLGNKEMSY